MPSCAPRLASSTLSQRANFLVFVLLPSSPSCPLSALTSSPSTPATATLISQQSVLEKTFLVYPPRGRHRQSGNEQDSDTDGNNNDIEYQTEDARSYEAE